MSERNKQARDQQARLVKDIPKDREALYRELGQGDSLKEDSPKLGLSQERLPDKRQEAIQDYVTNERLLDFEIGRASNLIGLSVLGATFMSGYMTFNGIMLDQIRDGGANLVTKLGVAGISVVLTVMMFVGFLAFLRKAPIVRTALLRGLIFLLLVGFTGWVVAVSSWYSFTGMSGAPAMAIYMSEETDRVADVADDVVHHVGEAKASLSALDGLAASACANQKAEQDSGLGTGSAGVGPFSMGLLSACTAARRVTDNLQAAAQRSDAVAEKLSVRLREIRQTVVNGETPILERERAFKAGMAEIDGMIRRLRSDGMVKGIESSLVTLENAVLKLPTDSDAFGAKQRGMLQAVEAQMRGAAQALRQSLADLKGGVPAEMVRPGRVSVTEVVLRYADRFIPNVLIAVGLDTYALFMTTFLLLAGAGKRKARRQAEQLSNR